MTNRINLKTCLLNLTILFIMVSITHGRPNREFRVKAVNLGGWLVTEGWMKPSLFDAIPNKDFLDGTGLQFKSMKTGKYLCAESGGGTILVANGTSASSWETFRLWRINDDTFRFRVFNKQFVGLNGINVVAVSNTSTDSETFHVVKESDNSTRVRIKASNGYFLQAKTEEKVSADVKEVRGWGNDDPTVFVLTIAARMQGEFQVTNGYGPMKASQVMKAKTEEKVSADVKEVRGCGNDDPTVFVLTIAARMQGEFQVTNGYGPMKASQVMKEHWSTFIVEDDFKFIANNGLNAVRIPVGWWIASDPTPPVPYVGGSLNALDNAFLWAEKYGLKIIIDLHAAPGSQNGYEHSSSRDGSQEWGKTDENIQQTVQVIEFLTARFAKSPSFYAIELLNEPRSPLATLESLNKYYKAGYEVVRKHSSTAYVVFSNRLGSSEPRELFPLANGLIRSVIDVHYYSIFGDEFNGMSAQQNIDFIYTNRSSELNFVTTSNGPLIFVGEWVAEWQVKAATKEDYKTFGKAQLDVYGRATFGWAYWAFKNINNHWSLEWMIKNGYIKL